jgi:hypothetical protein
LDKKIYLDIRASAIAMVLMILYPRSAFALTDVEPGDAIGTIERPRGTSNYTQEYGNGTENSILPFISTLLTIAAVFMGLWVLINLFLAGYTALTSSGDPQAMTKVRTSITNSVIGLLLIVLAYTIAALAGTIFFGDATLFIQPKFEAPSF